MFSEFNVSRPRRLDGISYVGVGQYFLTFCTWNRRQPFIDSVVVGRVLEAIRRTAADHRFALLAYCFARLVISPSDYPYLGSDVWPIEALLDSVTG